jgi:hypothetical protein
MSSARGQITGAPQLLGGALLAGNVPATKGAISNERDCRRKIQLPSTKNRGKIKLPEFAYEVACHSPWKVEKSPHQYRQNPRYLDPSRRDDFPSPFLLRF